MQPVACGPYPIGGQASRPQKGKPLIKLVAVNERGSRIGEGHQRASVSDHDVSLIVGLLNARLELIEQCTNLTMTRQEIDRLLCEKQLSYRWIAIKLEVSKSYVARIENGYVRQQLPAGWKRLRSGHKTRDDK